MYRTISTSPSIDIELIDNVTVAFAKGDRVCVVTEDPIMEQMTVAPSIRKRGVGALRGNRVEHLAAESFDKHYATLDKAATFILQALRESSKGA